MNAGLSLGRWFGISVRLHWSVALISVFLVAGLAGQIGSYPPAIVGVIGFLASILVHEFAHALTARRYGVGTESIQLWALGGVARLDREAPSARAEGWIAAAGPLGSVALGAAGIGAYWLLGGQDAGVYVGLLGWLGILNAILAVFNLLPGAPLDGGRIVKSVRWAMHGDRYKAAVEAGRAGVVLGWLMTAAGVGLMLSGRSGVWLLIVGLFILATAKVEISGAQLSRRLAGTKIRDLTWFGVAAADGEVDADAMLWDRRRLGAAGGVAVVDGAGVPQGLVLEDQLWAVPSEQRPWVALTQLMVPFDQTTKAAPDDELTSVLPKINPSQPMITVWDADRLVGMINPATMKQRLNDAGWSVG